MYYTERGWENQIWMELAQDLVQLWALLLVVSKLQLLLLQCQFQLVIERN